MVNTIIGFVLGFVVATIGFSGLANFLDENVNVAKEVVEQLK
jgi:capsular polysaccharide biosynthesis protein